MKVVIIQTAFIGDVVLCTPMIEVLHRERCKIGFVAKPEAAAIFENDPRLDRLHIFDKRGRDRGLSGIFRTSSVLRRSNYDVAIIPHRSIRSAVISFLAGIPRRIGFNRSAGKLLLTERIPYDYNSHEVIRNLSLIDQFGFSSPPDNPAIVLDKSFLDFAQEQFKVWNIKPDDPVIGFGPGSKWYTKRWEIESYKKLGELLVKQRKCKIICFGSPDENELCEEICASAPKDIFNAAGLFTLTQSAAALSLTKTAVTNDSGLMHIAAASGIPVVAVFGPTVPEFGFAPWGEKHSILGIDLYCRPCRIHGSRKCPENHFRCMKEITPEMVLNELGKHI